MKSLASGQEVRDVAERFMKRGCNRDFETRIRALVLDFSEQGMEFDNIISETKTALEARLNKGVPRPRIPTVMTTDDQVI